MKILVTLKRVADPDNANKIKIPASPGGAEVLFPHCCCRRSNFPPVPGDITVDGAARALSVLRAESVKDAETV